MNGWDVVTILCLIGGMLLHHRIMAAITSFASIKIRREMQRKEHGNQIGSCK